MKKIKILEVNNIDLLGKRFNGYDMITELNQNKFSIKQSVIIKQSDNKNVVKLLDNDLLINEFYRLQQIEEKLSIHNVFSITTPALLSSKQYKESDIIHFHMFHNTKLSIYSLIDIAKEKKVVITLHDPWFLTGRCVHFYNCPNWKTGCNNCNYLETLFPFEKDNCNYMWKLKKYVFDNIDVDLVVSSKWMFDLVKNSPIFNNQKNIHLIPFGIDLKAFNKVSPEEARTHFGFSKKDIVIFLRTQYEFKGTKYVLEALKELKPNKNLLIMTCDNKGLLDDLKDKFRILDLGSINTEEMIYAMNACDIFLMPSKGESFGMMAIEAMACGKPIIVFDNTALPSITHAPECGYLVKDKSSHDLMKAIEFLVNNPKERIRRGKLGKEICGKEYDINKYNQSLNKLYESVFYRKHQDFKAKKDKQENQKINILLEKINTNNIENDYKIDFSLKSVQNAIKVFNKKNYQRIKKTAQIKRIKVFVKRIIKKILLKNN